MNGFIWAFNSDPVEKASRQGDFISSTHPGNLRASIWLNKMKLYAERDGIVKKS
jgi:hypothetical protein